MIAENPLFQVLNAAFDNRIKGLMIGLPGMAVAYDPKTQRAQVECGVQRVVDGDPSTISVLINVPVQFAGSAAWSVFHELPAGTEGYIHFSQRAVDTWLDQGGPAAPLDARMFNATDAFFAPGYRSLKTAIPDLPTEGIGLSNADGTVRLHLSAGGVVLRAGGSVLELSPGGLKHNGKNIGATHKHGGVEKGGDTSEGPE